MVRVKSLSRLVATCRGRSSIVASYPGVPCVLPGYPQTNVKRGTFEGQVTSCGSGLVQPRCHRKGKHFQSWNKKRYSQSPFEQRFLTANSSRFSQQGGVGLNWVRSGGGQAECNPAMGVRMNCCTVAASLCESRAVSTTNASNLARLCVFRLPRGPSICTYSVMSRPYSTHEVAAPASVHKDTLLRWRNDKEVFRSLAVTGEDGACFYMTTP
ncbi:MAG: hypothetical protein FD172_3734 [Methylocystaceae bacterium]|nr:MAG: hypothetical protein FD172_3734 [Methylocystaceae bacterium]